MRKVEKGIGELGRALAASKQSISKSYEQRLLHKLIYADMDSEGQNYDSVFRESNALENFLANPCLPPNAGTVWKGLRRPTCTQPRVLL